MKPLKLSNRQKQVYDLLVDNPGGFVRRYVKPNNTICWRVLDEKLNPLLNASDFVIDGLIDKGVLELDKVKQNYVLKADTKETCTMDISKLGLVKS